ncbi:MAG: hypothetical protein K8T10_03365 [Candidatus Eremiobacteraeota bacterium]|nr:hypothetical protein [Candidatus Eremiobacteraeota bacterium]
MAATLDPIKCVVITLKTFNLNGCKELSEILKKALTILPLFPSGEKCGS